MFQRLLLIALLVVAATLGIDAQEAKRHLRDFTPKYLIDTFQINGEPTIMKRKVINAVETKGIKSAFWDDDTRLVTVQYDSKLISLDLIKMEFAHQSENFRADRVLKRKIPVGRLFPRVHRSYGRDK